MGAVRRSVIQRASSLAEPNCVLTVTRKMMCEVGIQGRIAAEIRRAGAPVLLVAAGREESFEEGAIWDNVPYVTIRAPAALRWNKQNVLGWLRDISTFGRTVEQLAQATSARAVMFEGAPLVGLARRLHRRRPDMPLVYLASELSCADTPWLYRYHERSIARELTGVVFNEPHRLAIWYRDTRSRVPAVVIPNTLSLSEAPTEPRRRDAILGAFPRAQTPLSTVAVYHGRLEEDRALQPLLTALAALPQDVGLLMIGGLNAGVGWEAGAGAEASVRQAIRRLGLADRVALLPFIPHAELLRLVQNADMGIMLYRDRNLNYYYCAPCKLYEYVACALPVIASSFKGLEGIVDRFGLGVTVNPESVDEIAGAIDRLRSPEERGAYAESARDAFRNHLCFERYWEKEGPTILRWLRV